MLSLRKATANDIDLLYEWANDPIVRANSFNSEFISYEEHIKWFNRIMSNDTVIQYILMDNDIPIGQIRLNVNGHEAEISYSIFSDYRGKGYGRSILELIRQEIGEQYRNINRLVAKVRPENIASQKSFEKAGYELKYMCYEYNKP